MRPTVTAVLRRPRHFDLESRELPAPGHRELLVRMEGSGICGSDLDLWRGRPWFEYPSPPGRPGHEGWGRVEEVGEEANSSPGTRVAVLSDQCFAKAVLVPDSEVVPIPGKLDSVPVPGEPLGCAFNVVRMAGVDAKDIVAVVGAGFLGILVAALAKGKGATVAVFSRRAHSRELATTMGADLTFSLQSASDCAGDFDVVVEATGVQAGIDVSTELVAPGGRLVIAGYHQDGARQVDMQSWNWNAIEVVNAHIRDPRVRLEGMREAIASLASGVFDPTPLYTHRYDLKNLDAAFATLTSRPSGFTKALVMS